MKLLLSLTILFLIQNASAGPVIVGGAGESEFSIVFVHSKLNEVLSDCENVTCDLTKDELKDFSVIQNAAKIQRTLYFKSSKEMGSDLFQIYSEGEVWINQSKLSQTKGMDHFYDIPNAISLWIRILASASKSKTPFIESILEKARKSFSLVIQRGKLVFDSQNDFEFLVWKNKRDQLFLRDSSLRFLEVSKLFDQPKLKCPGAITELEIYSPAWFPLKYSQEVQVPLTLRFGLSWLCDGRFFSTSGLVFLTATRPPHSNLFEFDLNSLEVFLNTGGAQ